MSRVTSTSLPPQTLRAILRKVGFSTVAISHVPTTNGIAGSLQYIWNEKFQNPKGARIRKSRTLALCLWPLGLLIALLGYGECIRAVAVKSETQ
jgi:hypothetical protein